MAKSGTRTVIYVFTRYNPGGGEQLYLDINANATALITKVAQTAHGKVNLPTDSNNNQAVFAEATATTVGTLAQQSQTILTGITGSENYDSYTWTMEYSADCTTP